MRYADVLLPLPLEGLFTYAIPPCDEAKTLVGCRVVVPLGAKKTYVALVAHCHDTTPSFAVRDIIAVLDDSPIILPTQYALWQWLAEYYLAPLGEVYAAALPAKLKTIEGYKARSETFVTLAPAYRTEEALQRATDALGRATKQRAVFVEYLAMSNWENIIATHSEQLPVPTTLATLINTAHTTRPLVRALCDRGLLTTYTQEVGRLSSIVPPHTERIKPLTTAQQSAYDAIQRQFASKQTVLLHGVTSSGKTEIYIHLIAAALARGEQVLYLLPEIALTVQIMQRLRQVFGSKLGIYHSRYSDSERVEIWKKQLSADPYDVVLGARSALFLPFRKLGLVIIDEEHDGSFKQQEPTPRYHARSAALMLARLAHAKTLLGTATPAIETYYNAQTAKYGFVALSTRYHDVALPRTVVVDVRDLRRRKMMRGIFSPILCDAIRAALDDNKQAILFHNRRGYTPEIECRQCGWVPRCTNCDVSLTLHRSSSRLVCHYCGYTYPIPARCPCCEESNLLSHGVGTERVEEELLRLFPTARVARMDLDSTRSNNAYDKILGDFAAGQTNILVGTQMVTKGLDFDRVAVVGILDADTLLNKPDFRAYERAYQMMTQVSGRAGRKEQQGLVILQTKNPSLPIIQQIVDNDYTAFYTATVAERAAFRYPPYSHIVNIYLRHHNDTLVGNAATTLAATLRATFGDRVLGPDRPAVARVKQQYLRTIMLKIENNIPLSTVRPLLRQAQSGLLHDKRYAAVTVFFDVDPQ